MWNRLQRTNPRHLVLFAIILTVSVVATILLWPEDSSQPTVVHERTRDELVLRDGRLHVKEEKAPFKGRLIENYGKDARKLEIPIQEGKAHGLSMGWFEDGQMETQETFVEGVSHGVRTRWYPSGAKKSETTIVDGVANGLHVDWHDNDKDNKAAEATMVDGQAHGLAESWYPSGKLKSRVQLENGNPVSRQFFGEAESIAEANKPLIQTAP